MYQKIKHIYFKPAVFRYTHFI